MAKEKNVSETKAKKEKLPGFEHKHESKASMDAAVEAARKVGHAPKRTRKFCATIDGKPYFRVATSKKDLYGRLGGEGLLKNVKIEEFDPPASSSVESTPEAILAAMSMLTPEQRSKVETALAKSGKK